MRNEPTSDDIRGDIARLLDTAERNGAFTPGRTDRGPTVEANNRDAYRRGLFSSLDELRAAIARERAAVERAERERAEQLDAAPAMVDEATARALDVLVGAGWSNRESGDVDSPTGAFALVVNDAADVASLVDVLDSCDVGRDEYSPDALVGAFVAWCDDRGFKYAARFGTADGAASAYVRLDADYCAWSADEDEDAPAAPDCAWCGRPCEDEDERVQLATNGGPIAGAPGMSYAPRFACDDSCAASWAGTAIDEDEDEDEAGDEDEDERAGAPSDDALAAAETVLRGWDRMMVTGAALAALVDAARVVAGAWSYGREDECRALVAFARGRTGARTIGEDVAAMLRDDIACPAMSPDERDELRTLAALCDVAAIDEDHGAAWWSRGEDGRTRPLVAFVLVLVLALVGALVLVARPSSSDPCDAVRDRIAATLDYVGDAATVACVGEEDDPRAFAALARGAADRVALHGPSESRSRGILAEGWSDPR